MTVQRVLLNELREMAGVTQLQMTCAALSLGLYLNSVYGLGNLTLGIKSCCQSADHVKLIPEISIKCLLAERLLSSARGTIEIGSLGRVRMSLKSEDSSGKIKIDFFMA